MGRCIIEGVLVPEYNKHCAREHRNFLAATSKITDTVSADDFKKCDRTWKECTYRKFRQPIEQLLQTAKVNDQCKGASAQSKYMSADKLNAIDAQDTNLAAK